MTQVIKDYTEMTSDPNSIEEIAKTIRTARYGKDVREAMAKGFEELDDDPKYECLKDRVERLEKRVDALEGDKKELIEIIQKNDETWQTKLNHVVLGTDESTVNRLVNQILDERGL